MKRFERRLNMLIKTAELIQLLEGTKTRAATREAEHIHIAIDTLEHTGLIGSTTSDSSKRIRRIVNANIGLITPDAQKRLKGVDVFGINIPVCDAFPRIKDSHHQLIIFDGLLYLIRFYADLQNLLALMNTYRSDAQITIDEEAMPEALALSLAAHALIVENIETGALLPDIGDLLGPIASKRAGIGYAGAVMFLLFHELGHIDCGHLSSGFLSERNISSLAIPEEINDYQNKEFEADRYAMLCMREELRNSFISSVIFFMAPFSFSETFSERKKDTHPLTVNRIAHLASNLSFPDDPELEEATRNIVNSEIGRFTRLAPQRADAGGSIRSKITEEMPISQAYRTIELVKRNIASNIGIIDFLA